MDIYISLENPKHKIVCYILNLIEKNHTVDFNYVNDPDAFQLEKLFSFNDLFYEELSKGPLFNHDLFQLKNNRITSGNGEYDLFASAVYLLNCVHEWGKDESYFDKIGRFMLSKRSISSQPQIQKNEVLIIFKAIVHLLGKTIKDVDSTLFVSHDIDTIHGSKLQDTFALFKQKKPLKAFVHGVHEFAGKSSWNNLEFISELNKSYGFNSTFFVLSQKGKGSHAVMNADYTIQEIERLAQKDSFRDAHFGLHKASTHKTIEEEWPSGKWMEKINRYHFLKFKLPDAWFTIAKAKIKMDASLGHAENYGFRNSYGLPFKPLNYKTLEAFDFLEVPLNLMDGTFHKYLGLEPNEAFDQISHFLKKHSKNCVLSLLWHNTYFTSIKYDGQLELYKKIMNLAGELGLNFVEPNQLLERYHD